MTGFRIMRRFAILIGLSALMGAGCSQAQVSVGWQDAAAQLRNRLQQAQTDPAKAPRIGNPADAALLHALFDLDGIWALDSQDFPAIDTRCDPVNKIIRGLNSLGAAPNYGGAPTAAEAAVSERNWARFPDELSLGSAASLLCVARESQAIAGFFERLPAEQLTPLRRNAAISGRQHASNALIMQIGMLSAARPYISAENRQVLLGSMVRAAPTLADAMTLAQRAGVRAAIDRISPGLTAADAATLDGIRRAFAGTNCTGLCAVAG